MNTFPRLPTPDPSDPSSIEAHKLGVLTEFAPLFDLIDGAMRDSVPKAKDVFPLLEGPVDPTVHAGLTRYLCKRFLASRNVVSDEEETLDFEVERIPNCGLCVNHGTSQIRILKAAVGGIPKASSEARSRFYRSNQFLLPFDKGQLPQMPLSLVVLWMLDTGFSYRGMEIACPRGEREDGSVDCYWITEWRGDEGRYKNRPSSPMAPDQDLDEIKPLEKRRKASS